MKTIIVDGVEYVEKGTELPVVDASTAPYQVGKSYFIRAVTHYYTGKLVWASDKELVLDTCAWVADTGLFANAVKSGTLKEVEPMGDGVIVSRGAIVDAVAVTWDLPTERK